MAHVVFVTNCFPGRAEDGVPRAADKAVGSGTNWPFKAKSDNEGFENQYGGMWNFVTQPVGLAQAQSHTSAKASAKWVLASLQTSLTPAHPYRYIVCYSAR
jgi:hypothetical protein